MPKPSAHTRVFSRAAHDEYRFARSPTCLGHTSTVTTTPSRTIAFLFPGQGSQEIGMGADLFDTSEMFRALVDSGSSMLGADLKQICLRGPARELTTPSRLQSLLSAVSLGYWHELMQRGVRPAVVLGHSLGEISSLAAAGVVSADTAVRIATYRGQLMDGVATKVGGGMLAALFVPLAAVEEVLRELNAPARIVLANDNAQDQIVLSGDNEMLDRFAAIVAQRQLGKCKRIDVAGPWHSPYMVEARHAFETWAEPLEFRSPTTPVVLNALAREESHPLAIKHLIAWQLQSPVFWRESMNRLHDMGVNAIVEVGPGRVLSGLARVNGFRKDIELLNANNLRGIEQIATTLGSA